VLLQAIQEIWGLEVFTSDLVATLTLTLIRRPSKPSQLIFGLSRQSTGVWCNSVQWFSRCCLTCTHTCIDGRTEGRGRWKRGTGKARPLKMQEWKTRDNRLWNAKCLI